MIRTVKAMQADWASSADIPLDLDGYCSTVEHNLLCPLSIGCRRSFEDGDGSELGKNGTRGKMQAVHSSSALACNVFDYWTDRDSSSLRRALGLTETLSDIRFEQKFPTGLGGNPPNLDVVIRTAGPSIAIESKFLEPYQPSPSKSTFRDTYFAAGRQLWSDKGLDRCQELAGEIHRGAAKYRLLDAAQLLKHMLGLASAEHGWRLICLWFRAPGLAGDLHARELDHFANRISADGLYFGASTYQQLFGRLSSDAAAHEHSHYLTYLSKRYFHVVAP